MYRITPTRASSASDFGPRNNKTAFTFLTFKAPAKDIGTEGSYKNGIHIVGRKGE